MYNFGKIKETYNNIYLETYSTSDDSKKKIYEYYLGKINKTPILKDEFESYYNIQNKKFGDELSSQIFIQDNIDAIKKLDASDLKLVHEDLINHLKTAGYNLVETIDERIQIFESLLSLDKKPSNLGKINDSLVKLRKTMIGENDESNIVDDSIDLPNNLLINMMVNKYNNKYSDLDEDTKKIIRTSLNGSIEDKIGMYNSTIKECLESINIKLKEADKDLDLKGKLLQTKEKLLEMAFNEETYIDDLAKVIDLKSNL